MAFFDLALNELKTYCPDRDEPGDFDSFWTSTLDEARAFALTATFEKVDFGLVAQETFDVTYNGFGGQPVKGWLILPSQRTTGTGTRSRAERRPRMQPLWPRTRPSRPPTTPRARTSVATSPAFSRDALSRRQARTEDGHAEAARRRAASVEPPS